MRNNNDNKTEIVLNGIDIPIAVSQNRP